MVIGRERKHASWEKHINVWMPSVPTENICLAHGVHYWEHRQRPYSEIINANPASIVALT